MDRVSNFVVLTQQSIISPDLRSSDVSPTDVSEKDFRDPLLGRNKKDEDTEVRKGLNVYVVRLETKAEVYQEGTNRHRFKGSRQHLWQ